MSELLEARPLEDMRRRFRDAMARIAYSVSAVTTDGVAGRDGVTVTAMLPVSDAGSVVLVCIRAGSRALPIIRRNGVFCVNILGEDHAGIADRFAGRERTDKAGWFTAGHWTTLGTGAPVLAEAIAAFDCRLVSSHQVAGHEVLLGAVDAVHCGDAGSPLLHNDRTYWRLAARIR